jgi:hypothetical protein
MILSPDTACYQADCLENTVFSQVVYKRCSEILHFIQIFPAPLTTGTEHPTLFVITGKMQTEI